MPVYAEGRVEHQKRTQTATTLWPFGFVFGVQLGLLEKKKTRRGPVRAALVQMFPERFRTYLMAILQRKLQNLTHITLTGYVTCIP